VILKEQKNSPFTLPPHPISVALQFAALPPWAKFCNSANTLTRVNWKAVYAWQTHFPITNSSKQIMFYPRLSPPLFISLPASVVTVCDIGQMSRLQISHRKIGKAHKIRMDQNSSTSKLGLMATFTQRYKPLFKYENEGVQHWSTTHSLW